MRGSERLGREHFEVAHLTSVKLPSAVTEVGDEVFYDCSDLRNAALNEGLQKIGKRSFRGCVLLRSIRLPSTITEVGNRSFWGCSSLTGCVAQ
ncbi:hypothetical protein ACHAXR_000044 [Thalassiosira sp. AJA248-18]